MRVSRRRFDLKKEAPFRTHYGLRPVLRLTLESTLNWSKQAALWLSFLFDFSTEFNKNAACSAMWKAQKPTGGTTSGDLHQGLWQERRFCVEAAQPQTNTAGVSGPTPSKVISDMVQK